MQYIICFYYVNFFDPIHVIFSSILEEKQLTWKFETWSDYHKSYCLRIISKKTKSRELKKHLNQIFEMGKFILVFVFISLFELMVLVDGEISKVKWNLQKH